MVEDSRRGKFRDACQFLILHVIGRVKVAAGKEGVLDACRQRIPEAYLKV